MAPQPTVLPAPPKSRARGAVLGLAWGETRGTHLGRATMQSLALVGAAIEHGHWSVASWVCWLLAAQRGGLWGTADPYLNEALVRLRRGEPPERTGYPTPRIGPASRVGPLGVLLRGDAASLVRATMESTFVTHADLRAAAMAFAVAYAVGRLVQGDDVRDVTELLPGAVRGVEDAWSMPRHPLWERDEGAPHAVSGALQSVLRQGAGESGAVRDRVLAAARPHMLRPVLEPNHPFVFCGGLHGLCAGLLSVEDPHEVLSFVAAQKGESALVGAIAGTVLGARHGDRWVGEVPSRVVSWADALASAGRPEDRDAFAGL